MTQSHDDSTQLALQIAATLSHHINSPLMASLLDIELLKRRLSAKDIDVGDVLNRLEETLLQIDRILKVAVQINEDGLPTATDYDLLFAQQLAELTKSRHTIDTTDESNG